MGKQYSEEFKEQVLKRVHGPNKISIPQLAKEVGVNKATIYAWKNEKALESSTADQKRTTKFSSQEKFHMVIESAAFTEHELGEYCRRKGIYVEDIMRWRNQCESSIDASKEDPKKLKSELKEEKEKTKRIERELRIKEKALAEAAALLVLRKNVQAIWGGQEEE